MTLPLQTNAARSALTQEQQKGRKILLLFFVGYVVMELTLIALLARGQAFAEVFSSLIRFALSSALLYAVWIGQRWARWLLVIVAFVGAVLCLFVIIARPGVIFFGACAFFTLMGANLEFSENVKSFLTFQRGNKRKPSRGPLGDG